MARQKKLFIAPTLEEFQAYFTENGYSNELAQRAWNGYAKFEWHDSRGNKVLNWRQKCMQVWFTDSNKAKEPVKKKFLGYSKHTGQPIWEFPEDDKKV